MFTGLIQQTCTVKQLSPGLAPGAKAGAQLTIDLQDLAKQVRIGDSVAVNGVCLTVAKLEAVAASFDISGETLNKTNLGLLKAGSMVNIELPLRPDDRLGGHFVLGHIDATATIKNIKKGGDFTAMAFAADATLLKQLIPAGSIAIDGISLTIAELNQTGFAVTLIPQTLKNTTLGNARVGEKVNIEIDIITKSVGRYLETILPRQDKLTVEKLQQLGF